MVPIEHHHYYPVRNCIARCRGLLAEKRLVPYPDSDLASQNIFRPFLHRHRCVCPFQRPEVHDIRWKGIIIQKWIGRKRIECTGMTKVTALDSSAMKNTTRKFGSGGAAGNWGFFYNERLGNFYAIITKNQDLVLVETNKRKYVFNCRERDKIVAYYNEILEKQL